MSQVTPLSAAPAQPALAPPVPAHNPAAVAGAVAPAAVASRSVPTSRKTDTVAPLKAAPTAEQLHKMVEEISAKVAELSPQLQFSIDKESGKTIIKVTDRNTHEVVWQFPTDEALQITRELDRFQKGLLLNRQA